MRAGVPALVVIAAFAAAGYRQPGELAPPLVPPAGFRPADAAGVQHARAPDGAVSLVHAVLLSDRPVVRMLSLNRRYQTFNKEARDLA